MYRSGLVTFFELLRGHIKMPKDANGHKMSIDTLHISFVIEKDGHLDNFSVAGNVDSLLKKAVFDGLAKCNAWNPTKVYGIPFRTQIIFPLSETAGYTGFSYQKEIPYKEKILPGN